MALTRALLADMTSRLGSAVQGWDYPLSHEARTLADLYDITVLANADPKKRSRIKPYPRPWPTQTNAVRSEKPTVDQATIKAALAARGH